ncbi:MAG: VWA domain-containing protein [Deltaproteobacteria bacterium]|nr:VWA domain-containing protein [Deltaproteobacteria bacterium]
MGAGLRWTATAVERGKERAREALVLVTVDPGQSAVRSPVAVNMVLDRSASMRGAPLAAVVSAARQLVDEAGPEDYLGLCLFDRNAEQRVKLCPMDAEGKTRMRESLSRLTTGGGTALHAALHTGAGELLRTLLPGVKQRMLLLTDGEPSVGPATLENFQRLGVSLAEKGLSIHALGVSDHYVPDILQALSGPSGTPFVHVSDPAGVGVAIGSVFSALRGEVAMDAKIRIKPSGFGSIRCIHGYPTHLEAGALAVLMGSLTVGQVRRVLLGGPVAVPTWSLGLTTRVRTRQQDEEQELSVQRVELESSEGKQVLRVVAELELVSAEAAAWAALTRKDKLRCGDRLLSAEARVKVLVALGADASEAQRHMQRVLELRHAYESASFDSSLEDKARQSAALAASHTVSRIMTAPPALFRRNAGE